MPHYKTLTEKDYLGAWDITRDYTLTIKKVEAKKVWNRKVQRETGKGVVWFKEAKKGLLLNATTGDTIAGMYGSDYSKWIGQTITLYPTTTTVGRETVPCIRVRERKPQAPPEQVPDREVDPAMRAQQNEAFERAGSADPPEPGSDG